MGDESHRFYHCDHQYKISFSHISLFGVVVSMSSFRLLLWSKLIHDWMAFLGCCGLIGWLVD